MADNNNNNAFTVTITPQTFNGIITGNGDGTYNVTYTSLTEDQIHDIGQQFAKHLSDTDENGNSKAGLHKVALTGDYTQLENKPSASKLQGFHKVAFSGKTSHLDNDEGFLTTATNAYTGSPASTITQNRINEWDNKVNTNDLAPIATTGNYTDLNGAPALPEDNIAYDIINEGETNESRTIKSLKNVAFTGNYNDLFNIPQSFNKKINFASFSNTEATLSENNKLLTLGTDDCYILNFNQLKNQDNQYLNDIIKNIVFDFKNNLIFYILCNNINNFLITDVYADLINNDITNPNYIIITYSSIITNNYYTEQYKGNNFTIEEAENLLNNNLELNVIYNGILIFDYRNNIIYCKTKKS